MGVMGEHNLSLAVFASDAKALKNHVADAKNLLAESGAVAGREDLGLESAFWSQLPGNHAFRIRPALITSRNFTAMAPLHNFPAGHRSGNEWGSAIAKLRSTAGTPFYFNFHGREERKQVEIPGRTQNDNYQRERAEA